MNKSLMVLAVLALGQAAVAQQPPTAGTLQVPAAPAAPAAAPDIRIEQRAAPAATAPPANPLRILVRALNIEGEHVFAERDLLALTGFQPGTELSLQDLQAMADRITAHYRRSGYLVARAYLPAQDIRDHAVTIAVSEGRLGTVRLRNQSGVSDRIALGVLDGLQSGEVIATPALESRLLLLSDLPGVEVTSTLVPGTEVGSSDLVVDLKPGRRVTGSLDADNAGNRYTGASRVGATINLNEPFGWGDVASLRLLTSGEGLQYARVSYQAQAGRAQLGAAYSHLAYELGKEFASLVAHGTARIASAYARYPLVRSRNHNLYAQLAFDAKAFDDQVDAIPSATRRDVRVLMASLFGDHRDSLGGGGASSWFLTWSSGELDIETPAARAVDLATARTQGHFDKLSFSAMRLQSLGGRFSASVAASGQLASKNLDVSEKMSLGGMNGVRAYPEGEAYGDQGYLLVAEGRMDLPPLPQGVPGRMQLVAFVDAGRVMPNREPWAAGSNRRTLSGAGVGVDWGDPGNFLVRAFYARKLGDEAATSSPDRSGRFWLQLVKYL